jgi:monooxygenase
MSNADTAHIDVMIVGAGLSGIGAACHLSQNCPSRSYALLERRPRLGGTWDLFRYPGVRSDSDMHTLGYVFKPWVAKEAIADGPAILSYLKETARIYGVDEKIRFNHHLLSASWDSAESRWTLMVDVDSIGEVKLTCNFLVMCAGYYDYGQGHTPDFIGMDDFNGTVVHPQHWPEDLDYADKKVVIIGSGATAVTLVPAMAKTAARVTMLQRSPTYIAAMPRVDRFALALRALLPESVAYALIRRKNIGFQQFVYGLSQKRPAWMKRQLLKRARKALGQQIDVDAHFSPSYNPWSQRLCVAPDGDFFKAIKSGDAHVVTDTIESITPDGITLNSGQHLEADIIITATGLKLNVLGDVTLTVDGTAVDLGQTYVYKGLAYAGVPNLCSVFGYVNASWTLRSDLICQYVCRVLNYMDEHQKRSCVPRLSEADSAMTARPFVDGFTPGYLTRIMSRLPNQGDRSPWLNTQNYQHDVEHMNRASVDDGVMCFD